MLIGSNKEAGIPMILNFGNKKPPISKSVFIAGTACISIGKECSIQDNAVIHSDENEVKIGDGAIIGHGSIIHGNLINNNVLIGMNSTILNGVEIGEYAIVGAGALVPPNYKVPANTVVMGVPCKEIRKTNEEDIEIIRNTIKNYGKLTEEYLKMKG
jgi:carbonic anhydrase/acetyltransferase-like protein (isoleucine patch superfamily)